MTTTSIELFRQRTLIALEALRRIEAPSFKIIGAKQAHIGRDSVVITLDIDNQSGGALIVRFQPDTALAMYAKVLDTDHAPLGPQPSAEQLSDITITALGHCVVDSTAHATGASAPIQFVLDASSDYVEIAASPTFAVLQVDDVLIRDIVALQASAKATGASVVTKQIASECIQWGAGEDAHEEVLAGTYTDAQLHLYVDMVIVTAVSENNGTAETIRVKAADVVALYANARMNNCHEVTMADPHDDGWVDHIAANSVGRVFERG